MITNQLLKMIAFAEIFCKKIHALCASVRTHTTRGHATMYTFGHGLVMAQKIPAVL